jgi:hypothetical protein
VQVGPTKWRSPEFLAVLAPIDVVSLNIEFVYQCWSMCQDSEMPENVAGSNGPLFGPSRKSITFRITLPLVISVLFAYQRDTIGAVVFFIWAIGAALLMVVRIPFRKRLMTRLYRSIASFLAVSMFMFIFAVNLMTQHRWAEAIIFFCLGTVPTTVAGTLIGFSRKTNASLKDQEQQS